MDHHFARQARRAALALAALTGASAALAAGVNDLPGGPAVNQLNLHPAVTRIAADISSLHIAMLVICLVIFVAVFG
ncbi:MAG: cytochrome c oxidase subunit II, partial [Burkholderiaceae bacterium]